MSKLDELIQELCPDGVEYRPFGEMATIVRGASPRPIKNFVTADANGVNWIKIGDVKQGSKYITETAEKITPDGAKKSRFVKEGDFILSNSMSFGRPYIMKTQGCIHDGWLSISDFDAFFVSDFLYHLLNSNKYQQIMRQKASFGGAVQNLNADIVRALEMPVVPVAVQREIVRILDAFTELTTELTAELTARKQQYEYYRDELLANNENVQFLPLNNIAKIYDGTHQTPEYKDCGIPFISVENIGDIYNSKKYITREAFEAYKIKPRKGDLFMTRIGSIGVCAVFDRDAEIAYYVSLALIRPDESIVTAKYLKYIIESSIGRKELRKRTLVNAVPIKVNKDDIGKIVLPIPPMEVQNKIVQILDRFDTLCNDISAGLPAEIEARRKQYEYYRDKLLTFKEVGA